MLLAASDNVTIFLALFQLVFSAVVSVSLWRLTAWQRRYEGLEGKLNDASAHLIDERFGAIARQVDRHVQAMVLTADEFKQRMLAGDADLRALGERDQRIELTLATRIDLLKDYIRETAASKKDLERCETAAERRLGVLEQRLSEVAATVAEFRGR